MKEFFNRNSQPITQFLNCGDGGAAVASTDNIMNGRLGDTTDVAQLIDGKILLLTQLQNALFDCFTHIHEGHPAFDLTFTSVPSEKIERLAVLR